MWFDKMIQYLSRKFVLTGAALVGSFVLAYSEKDLTGWATVLGVVLVPYLTGNVAETYFANKKANPPPAKSSQINVEDATVVVEAKEGNQ